MVLSVDILYGGSREGHSSKSTGKSWPKGLRAKVIRWQTNHKSVLVAPRGLLHFTSDLSASRTASLSSFDAVCSLPCSNFLPLVASPYLPGPGNGDLWKAQLTVLPGITRHACPVGNGGAGQERKHFTPDYMIVLMVVFEAILLQLADLFINVMGLIKLLGTLGAVFLLHFQMKICQNYQVENTDLAANIDSAIHGAILKYWIFRMVLAILLVQVRKLRHRETGYLT